MKKEEKGITLIALIVTIIVLLIIAGISMGKVMIKDNIMNRSNESTTQAERRSIIEKIEADIYTEQQKKGKNLTKVEAEKIIERYRNNRWHRQRNKNK